MDLASMVKKSDKIKTISCHVLRNDEPNSIKENSWKGQTPCPMLTSKMTNHSQMTIM